VLDRKEEELSGSLVAKEKRRDMRTSSSFLYLRGPAERERGNEKTAPAVKTKKS